MNKSRRTLCRHVGLALCLLMIFTVLPVPVAASETKTDTESKTVRVGWYPDSYHITGENGERSGYGYEYEQAVAAYTGWNYEYIKGDWGELVEKLQNGEIDLMAALSYTDERAETMLFSDLPMGKEKYYLYADLSDTDISAYNFQTLNGKRIGVLKGTQPEVMLTEWEQKYNLETTHVNIANNDDVKRKLADHEIDAFVSLEESLWAAQGISTVVNVGKSGIYYAINKDHPEIKELDNAMRRLEDDNPFYLADLYKQYFSMDYTPILSGEEKKWLKEHGAIRIGFLKDDTGISTIEMPDGRFSGASRGASIGHVCPEAAAGGGEEKEDPLFLDAIGVAFEFETMSTSLLQRRLSVGYSRAQKMIDMMEARGYVGKFDTQTKKRKIVITFEEYQQLRLNKESAE